MNTNTKVVILMLSIFSTTILYILFDDPANLGCNYYHLSQYEAYDIGLPGEAMVYKSQQKNSFSEIIISSEVIDVDYNDKYIVALQKEDSLLPNLEDTLLFNYYIISKVTDSIYGPFTKTEYTNTSLDLGLNGELELCSLK